jgi:hypothetical protein
VQELVPLFGGCVLSANSRSRLVGRLRRQRSKASRDVTDTPPEGKNFDATHAFYCGQDRPKAVLYTSNPLSNFAVVTARGTPGIMRLWDILPASATFVGDQVWKQS